MGWKLQNYGGIFKNIEGNFKYLGQFKNIGGNLKILGAIKKILWIIQLLLGHQNVSENFTSFD